MLTPEELQILKDLAAESKASRTPDERLLDELTEYYGGMAWATAQRLTEEFARDGWVVTSVVCMVDGRASIEIYRSDLAALARAAIEEGRATP